MDILPKLTQQYAVALDLLNLLIQIHWDPRRYAAKNPEGTVISHQLRDWPDRSAWSLTKRVALMAIRQVSSPGHNIKDSRCAYCFGTPFTSIIINFKETSISLNKLSKMQSKYIILCITALSNFALANPIPESNPVPDAEMLGWVLEMKTLDTGLNLYSVYSIHTFFCWSRFFLSSFLFLRQNEGYINTGSSCSRDKLQLYLRGFTIRLVVDIPAGSLDW